MAGGAPTGGSTVMQAFRLWPGAMLMLSVFELLAHGPLSGGRRLGDPFWPLAEVISRSVSSPSVNVLLLEL
jgi:hypothetical protein